MVTLPIPMSSSGESESVRLSSTREDGGVHEQDVYRLWERETRSRRCEVPHMYELRCADRSRPERSPEHLFEELYGKIRAVTC